MTTAPALDVRECLRHYADEIREYIEDTGRAPMELARYTCGADYQHEAQIDPALFAAGIQRINTAAHSFRARAVELREVIDSAIRNL